MLFLSNQDRYRQDEGTPDTGATPVHQDWNTGVQIQGQEEGRGGPGTHGPDWAGEWGWERTEDERRTLRGQEAHRGSIPWVTLEA